MIEEERKREDQREIEMNRCKDDRERLELDHRFGAQRAEAQSQIRITMRRHRDELAMV